MNKTYIVAPGRTAWSNKEQKHFYEGEVIDISHLSTGDLAEVLASGVIVEQSAAKEKVTNGKTNLNKTDSTG